jgi:hypothetical protein
LFVHVDKFLAGVLEKESPGQQKECREQIAEEQHGIQADGPTIIVKDCLPVRNQELESIHHKEAEGHEESQCQEQCVADHCCTSGYSDAGMHLIDSAALKGTYGIEII